MRIISFQAENIKKIKAVKFRPDKHLVEIFGENDNGKTSLLESIWFAIDYASTSKGQSKIVRTGENTATIRLDIGDGQDVEYTIERIFYGDGRDPKLSVYNSSGGKQAKPQTIIDSLIGALSFDPITFMKEKPQQQFEMLRELVDVDVDFEALASLNRTDTDRRTDVNRDLAAIKAQAEGLTFPPDLPADPVDTSALTDELMQAANFNADIERRALNRETAAKQIAGVPERIEEIKAEATREMEADRQRWVREDRVKADEIETLKKRLAALEAERVELNTKGSAIWLAIEEKRDAAILNLETVTAVTKKQLDAAPALPEKKDAETIRAKIAAAEPINEAIKRRTRKTELLAKVAELDAQSKALTEAIKARDDERARAIREAKMPIAGLGFGDNEIYYDGVPFSQAAYAVQVKVSVAIAMGLNPTLRVIRIKDASLLDKKSWQAVYDAAVKNDFQVWMEELDPRGPTGIEIVDGEVRAPAPATTEGS